MKTLWSLIVLGALLIAAKLADSIGDSAVAQQIRDPLGGTDGGLDPRLLATGTAFGLLMLGAWLMGRIAKSIALPMISGYLVFGLLAGPKGPLGVIDASQLEYLKLVDNLAIALIALTAGSEIRVSFLKGAFKSIAMVLGVQVLFVVVGMTFLFAYALSKNDWVSGSGLGAALAFASIATASSPAVVIAILTELHARGPLAQLTLAITVCKDLAVIVLFTLAIALATGGGGDHSVTQELVWHVGGSIVAGIMVGVLLTTYLRRVGTHLPIFLVFTGFGIALLSDALHFEPLIVALIAGMLMRNAWEEESEVFFETVEDLSLPVYCIFFAVAGAKLDVLSIAQNWEWVLGAAAARATLLLAGTWLGAKIAGVGIVVRKYLWMGFVSRAGVSIALAGIAARSLGSGEEQSDAIFNFLLATIAIDEVVGPLLLKLGLIKAGEAEGQKPAKQSGSSDET